MADNPTRFTVIQGGEQPKPYRARTKHEGERIVCRGCNGSTWEEVVTGLMWYKGRIVGGSKQWACQTCKTIIGPRR